MATNSDPWDRAARAAWRAARTLGGLCLLNCDRLAVVLVALLVWAAAPGPDWARPLLAAGSAAVFGLALWRTALGVRLRSWLASYRRAAPTARRARRSLVAAGIGTAEQPPKVRARETPAGVLLTVKTPPGKADAAVYDLAPALASDLRALAVRPSPTPRHGRAVLLVQHRDPLASALDDPPLTSDPTDLADPAPLGLDEWGRPVSVPLWATSVLVAGQSGSGKSVALRSLVVWAGLDPSALLIGADLKPGALEFHPMRQRFDLLADDAASFADALGRVWAEIQRRKIALLAEGLRKVPTDRRAMFPPIVVVLDEAAEVARDPEHGADALATLTRVMAVGRAFGVSVIAATQSPTAEAFGGSTAARNLFAHSICFRVRNKAAAEVALGAAPPPGLEPWTFPKGTGIGVVLDADAEDDRLTLRRFRAWHLDEAEGDRLMRAAASHRGQWLHENPDAVRLPAAYTGPVVADDLAEFVAAADADHATPKRRRNRKGRT